MERATGLSDNNFVMQLIEEYSTTATNNLTFWKKLQKVVEKGKGPGRPWTRRWAWDSVAIKVLYSASTCPPATCLLHHMAPTGRETFQVWSIRGKNLIMPWRHRPNRTIALYIGLVVVSLWLGRWRKRQLPLSCQLTIIALRCSRMVARDF